MPNTTAQKLRIREGMTLLTVHAPVDFAEKLAPLPPGVQISDTATACHQIHWFVKTRAEMEAGLTEVLRSLQEEVLCWIYYLKGASGMQTDLTRDKGWEALRRQDALQWLSLISFDDTWSAFAVRRQSAAGKTAESVAKARPIFDWVDPETKTVRLPEDVQQALDSDTAARAHFESLAFTHKKEYLEWIISAKKNDTRQQRIQSFLQKLKT